MDIFDELEEAKDLVWNDDDEYEYGYNAGIDRAISIIKTGFTPKLDPRGGWFCGNCGKVIHIGGAGYCWYCGRVIEWQTAGAEH